MRLFFHGEPAAHCLRRHGLKARTAGRLCALSHFARRAHSSRPREQAQAWRWLGYASLFTIACGLGAAARRLRADPAPVLREDTFSTFSLVSKQDVSPTSAILTLGFPNGGSKTRNSDDLWESKIWSVQIKQPQLQIGRSYTPLPPSEHGESHQTVDEPIRLLVRRELKGEMSNYLHSRPEAATVHMRGPVTEYDLPEDIDEVLFLAGGTGIAPALQASHALLTRARRAQIAEAPKIRILWANRKRDDCVGAEAHSTGWSSVRWLKSFGASGTKDIDNGSDTSIIVQELQRLQTKSRGQLSVHYFIDEKDVRITPRILQGYMGGERPAVHENHGRRLILVSGPDGFVAHFAGPKLWRNGREIQGPLQGVLGDIGSRGWDIWKL